MTEKELLEKLATFSLIEELKYLFIYGSNSDLEADDKDIDLLAVVNNPRGYLYYKVEKTDQVDLIIVNEDYFQRAISNFEPLVLEPLLKGRLLRSFASVEVDFRQKIWQQEFHKKNLVYLTSFAFTLLCWAFERWDKKNYEECLMNLTYVFSYAAMAENLSKYKEPVFYWQLLAHPDYGCLRKIRASLKLKQFDQTEELLNETFAWLKGQLSKL